MERLIVTLACRVLCADWEFLTWLADTLKLQCWCFLNAAFSPVSMTA